MRHNPNAKSTLYLGKHCPDVLYYYHSDHIGSSTFLTDALGIPYQFMLYLPFGEAMAQQKVAGWGTPYTFTGKEQDAATGLHYFGARYLDTRLSMWFGVDPLADAPENIGYSSYHYVWNNPIRYIDPTGMHGESTHLDEDGNLIAYFEDGDNGVYMHCNGTKESDIQAHNYYQSGQTGTNVTNGGGTQIAGMEVSITTDRIKNNNNNSIAGGNVIWGIHPSGILEGAKPQSGGKYDSHDMIYTPGNYKSVWGQWISFYSDMSELYKIFNINSYLYDETMENKPGFRYHEDVPLGSNPHYERYKSAKGDSMTVISNNDTVTYSVKGPKGFLAKTPYEYKKDFGAKNSVKKLK